MLRRSKITLLGLSITEANSVMLAQAWITRGKRTLLQLDKQFPCQGTGPISKTSSEVDTRNIFTPLCQPVPEPGSGSDNYQHSPTNTASFTQLDQCGDRVGSRVVKCVFVWRIFGDWRARWSHEAVKFGLSSLGHTWVNKDMLSLLKWQNSVWHIGAQMSCWNINQHK